MQFNILIKWDTKDELFITIRFNMSSTTIKDSLYVWGSGLIETFDLVQGNEFSEIWLGIKMKNRGKIMMRLWLNIYKYSVDLDVDSRGQELDPQKMRQKMQKQNQK